MNNVPEQHTGSRSDIRKSKTGVNEQEGKRLYEKARNNLLDINKWKLLAGKLSAHFVLTDHYGKKVNRYPLNGDYIRINLPNSPDDKFDWVRIERIEEQAATENYNKIIIQVRPSDEPRQKEETEHFFSKEATSNFSVERNGSTVTVFVSGRNELPNLDEKGLLSKVRNMVIAVAAMAGANTPQWKSLAKGILEK